MKEGIHPKYFPNATVVCSCGNTWTTGSTRETIRTDVCFQCHPFFTGEQRIVDTEGQVDRFYKKLEARDQHRATAAAREAARSSTDQPVTWLELGDRPTSALIAAGLNSVTDILARLAEGDEGLLAVEGFGRKSLIDLKKRLRQRGLLAEEAQTEPAAE